MGKVDLISIFSVGMTCESSERTVLWMGGKFYGQWGWIRFDWTRKERKATKIGS